MDITFVTFIVLACFAVILLVCFCVSGCNNWEEEKNLSDAVDLENSQTRTKDVPSLTSSGHHPSSSS
ncbi:predicted protein [Arabidopsis lyrata subsp. lyrata]|uniref:Predicted protein n=1 Tax=Arabidopsis lyrata subsp. lyrata TaxID=81972 RepID=D7LKE9_ARALL|nr:predicted protein [Arabidopsis lyrata subsp. lyrata]